MPVTVRRLVRAFRAAADGKTAEMPVAARNQSAAADMAAADMAAADAAVRDALQSRSGVVLDQWLERIGRPLRWAHSQAGGFEDFAAAGQEARMMTIPGEVTLADCTVARSALEAFRLKYQRMNGPGDLRTLPADQSVLESAVEAARQYAKIGAEDPDSIRWPAERAYIAGTIAEKTPAAARNQSGAARWFTGDPGMDAADAALLDALRARARVVLGQWLERIDRPLRWTHSRDGWRDSFPHAPREARALDPPGEVTLEDCPVARAALGSFAMTYDPVFVRPDILRMLPADQPVLKSAVEAARRHAKIR